MSEVDTYIKENAEVHQFAAEVARIISDAGILVRNSDRSRREPIDRTSCNSNPGRDCVRMVANWSGCAE